MDCWLQEIERSRTETEVVESARDFLALRSDFINDKDGRHRDLSAGRSTYTQNAVQKRFPF